MTSDSTIGQAIKHYKSACAEVKIASGDYIDMKVYEPSMRYLIDAYIQAEESKVISAFDNISLVQLIVENGEDAIKQLPKGIQNNEQAVAETIENNIRKVIIDEQPVNPKYYEKMSELLDALIQERKDKSLKYKDYLKEVIDLSCKVSRSDTNDSYPEHLNSTAKKALYDNLGKNVDLALKVHKMVMETKKDNWRGNQRKEREIKLVIGDALENTTYDSTKILELVKKQNEY